MISLMDSYIPIGIWLMYVVYIVYMSNFVLSENPIPGFVSFNTENVKDITPKIVCFSGVDT